MFIGHFGLGLAAKRAAPRLSLGVLFAAAQFADLLWPVLVAAGLEKVRILPGITAVTPLEFVSYPYSHSLLLLILWGAAMAFAFARRDRRAFIVVSLLVVSHWLLDFISHRPDMPLYPGGARYGLGLWNSPLATVAVELPIYLAGVWLYLGSTRARDGIGRWSMVLLLSALLVIYAGNFSGQPPPPSVNAIVMVGLFGGALLTAWAWWADRHRDPVAARR